MEIGIDTLCTCHLLIAACCADRMSLLCSKIPVENCHNHNTEQYAGSENPDFGCRSIRNVTQGYCKIIFINTDCLIRAAHYIQINGVQGYQHDFGYNWDDGESNYPYYFCKDRYFKPIKPSDRVLNRYNITKEEYNTICQELTRKLHVGSCGRCI